MSPLLCSPDSVKLVGVCKQLALSRGICADVRVEANRASLSSGRHAVYQFNRCYFSLVALCNCALSLEHVCLKRMHTYISGLLSCVD